ncbi:unnamed protein product [Spirodela intermedia]|uniref:Uncharacterized protein n=1 Tax=Spirodela intermedia TaxID=51605 RepID=A0A7I8KRV5_SPIIN|nr:unnamed protein product [Spirodela intermedia]
MELGVRRGDPVLVPPAGETKKGLYFLSNLDQNIAVVVRTVYCFGPATPPVAAAAVMREALGRVLVHYYPLAGRVVLSSEGKLAVDCTGEGAVFVEADAGCDLAALGDISSTDTAALGTLVCDFPGTENLLQIPPFAIQVTRFRCGGFTLGLSINHCMFDGAAAMEFINSWAEMARGSPLSLPPFLHRSLLAARSPPQIRHPHPEFSELRHPHHHRRREEEEEQQQEEEEEKEELQYRSFCFSPEQLEELKRTAAAKGELTGCTSFEALAGLIWRTRAAALRLPPSQPTKLLFAVDVRQRVAPPLPPGYFGNGIVLTCAGGAAGELVGRPLGFAVGEVQKAIRRVDDDFVRSAIDFFEVTRARPSLAATFLVTAWSKLPFDVADFGWGPPLQAGPAALPEKEVALFLSHGREKKSVNVLLGLPAVAMDTFQRLLEAQWLT